MFKKIYQSIDSLLKLAIIGGCIYVAVTWGYKELQSDEYSHVAESDCADEIASRHDARSVSIYGVSRRENGYVVRASATLARGDRVKFYCLTNRYGGVEDISVEGR